MVKRLRLRLYIIGGKDMTRIIPLEHPGIILKEEFIEALELTAYAV